LGTLAAAAATAAAAAAAAALSFATSARALSTLVVARLPTLAASTACISSALAFAG
jgi:hypothetical protein